MTPESLQRLRALAEQATKDWPEVKEVLRGYAGMAYVHGSRYQGPSIDFDAVIAALPDLLAEIDRRAPQTGVQNFEEWLIAKGHATWPDGSPAPPSFNEVYATYFSMLGKPLPAPPSGGQT